MAWRHICKANARNSAHCIYRLAAIIRYTGAMQYRAHPKIKRLISLCRTEIVYARVMLARSPGPEHRRLLSGLIENRELFIRMVSENYDDEMENIDREIESVLTH
jgi:hypothetical protein